jgi:hypothetical protein
MINFNNMKILITSLDGFIGSDNAPQGETRKKKISYNGSINK